jgi:hypothetical protein
VIVATLREDTETIINVDEIVATEKRLRGARL